MTRDEERIEQIEKFASQCYEDGERYSSFIAGAIWSDNNPVNVWHEASEKPRAKEWLLIQFGEDDYDVLSLDDLYIDMWCTWCKTYNVIRWAYISDLLPKQFGNSERLKGGEE